MKALFWILGCLGALWFFCVGEEYDPYEEDDGDEEIMPRPKKGPLLGRRDSI